MGWLDAWLHRKNHTINGTTAGAQTNYQVRVRVLYGSGADSGEDVYLGGKCRSDFGDIRFTKSDGSSLLDYWMETKVNGNYAVFWVEVDSIPASPNSATIYIYYAKSDAVYPYLSNEQAHGEATFPFFDNFSGDLSKWTILDGTWAIVAGELRHTGAGADRHIRSASYQIQNGAIEYKIKMGSEVSPSLCNVIGRMVDINNFYDAGLRYVAAEGKRNVMDRKLAGGWTTVWVACPWAVNTWYKAKFILYGNSEKAYINDVYEVTATWSDFASGYVGFKANMPAGTFAYIDDFRVRKYVSPEPSHGAWGSEETTPIPPPNKIDLRLSDVTPPDPDIPKTIYRDLFTLPATMKLGITIRYFNWDDVQLYFRVTGLAPGYSFGTVSLGALASGGSAYRNLDQFASRSKPAGEVEEEIILILRAYTDVAYTNLKWTYERVVHVVIIDSNDPGYTVDFLNNFDDGTVQGWAVSKEYGPEMDGGHPVLEVVTDYVLSAPYSIRMRGRSSISIYQDPCYMYAENRVRLYKSFTTPDRAKVFAIFDLRSRAIGSGGIVVYVKYLSLQRDGVVQVFWGRPVDAAQAAYYPTNRWIRGVIPLPRNTVVELRIVSDWRMHNSTGTSSGYGENQIYMDDFRIISKA